LRRFFVQNIIFLLLVNLIVKPLWIFGIDRNVQLAVGHEAYGQYVALLNFSLIFQVLLDFGLQNYNNRTIAQSPGDMKSLFPNVIIAKALLSFGYFILVIILGWALGYRGYSLFLLILLIFVQILNSFLLYLRSNVSGMHWFKTDSLLSVSDRLFMILMCSVLLFHPAFAKQFKMEWFIMAQIVAYMITALFAFIVCTKLTKLDWSHFDFQKVRTICVQSFPYALLIFLMAIYIRSDVFLMERMLKDGKYEAGVYAASYRFLDVSNNVTGVLFAGILLPLFGSMLAKKEQVQPLVKLSLNLLLPVALTAMFIAIFFGQDIMHLQLKNLATDYDGKVFAMLMMSFPGYCIGYVYSTLLTANGSIKPLILVSVIAVIINIILNLILLPRYGAWGGALTCVITQVFLSVANIYLAKKVLHLKTDIGWILKYVLFVFVIALVCFGALHLSVKLWQQILMVIAGSGVTMFICGFLPFHKLKELLKNR
jgi:O-antigen/teichoic acid export membrane protein